MSHEVVVTGLGAIGSFGGGREDLAAALLAGRPHLAAVDRAAGYHRPGGARQAALVGGYDLSPWVPAREGRRMSPPSKLALAAARMALADSGRAGEPLPGAAVVISTSYGPASYTEGLLKQILDSPESASPFLFTESVANAPAAQIGIAMGATGAGLTIAQREAGPLLTVLRGAAEIAAGRAPLALVGTVEEMTPLLHAVLDRFGALAGADGTGQEVARPFDRRRTGFLAGDGSAVLVLEDAASAAERGRRPLARLLGGGRAFDPSAPPTGWGEGHAALARGLLGCLERAGLTPADVDLIVSGASGARGGDRLEALTLKAAWGDQPLPPLLVPKAVVGEYGGGFLAAAVLAAAGVPFGPAPGFSEVDPELGIVPHPGGPLPAPSRVLVSTLAAGGAAAWLLLGAAEPGESEP